MEIAWVHAMHPSYLYLQALPVLVLERERDNYAPPERSVRFREQRSWASGQRPKAFRVATFGSNLEKMPWVMEAPPVVCVVVVGGVWTMRV